MPSRPINSAILMSSPMGFFLSSVKFISGQTEWNKWRMIWGKGLRIDGIHTTERLV